MLSYELHNDDGSAPIVLYLHGLGIAGWCWDPVYKALPGHAALIPDLPGHGGSAETEWQSLSDTAEKVAQVVDMLPNDRQIHMTGHSLGAYVGLELLTKRPHRFTSALLSGFHIGRPRFAFLLKCAYAINGLIFGIPCLLRRFARIFGNEIAARRFIEGAKAMHGRTMRQAGIQVVDFTLPGGLSDLHLPITAIAADREPEAIRKAPAQLEDINPHIEGKVLNDRDHLWPLKEAGLYAELLKQHIQDAASKTFG